MKFLNFFVSEFGAKGNCNPFGITKRQKSPQRKLGTFCLVEFDQVYLNAFKLNATKTSLESHQ